MKRLLNTRWKNSGALSGLRLVGYLFIVGLLVMLTLGLLYNYLAHDNYLVHDVLPGYCVNIYTELIGILTGVLMIDRLREYEAKERYKQSLKRQARSRSNANAIDAVETIRDEKWLDGTEGELLAGADLSSAQLAGANFGGAYLRETKFNHANLERANFEKADLRDAKFQEAQLKHAQFVGADISGVDFSGAELEGCVFLKTDWQERPTQFWRKEKGESQGQGVTFDGAKLVASSKDQKGREGKEKHPNFKRANLRQARFVGAELKGVSFEEAILEGSNFAGARLEDVDFSNARMNGTSFSAQGKEFRPIRDVGFHEAKLKRAHMENVPFESVEFGKANLDGAKCKNASFRGGTDFCGSTLKDMDVQDAEFIDVRFDGATTFFDGKTLQEHWNELEKDEPRTQEDEQRTQEIEKRFRQRLENIANDKGIRTLSAEIEILAETKSSWAEEEDSGKGESHTVQIDFERARDVKPLPPLKDDSTDDFE